jgi:aspartate/methionine/tyrosine aminotransferase
VGFAPGATFGPGGEGFLRMCYLRDPVKVEEALNRFHDWLRTHRPG